MKNFKAGQKVVYVPFINNNDDYTIVPKPHEIVTIKGRYRIGAWYVEEYQFNSIGDRQAFNEIVLHPIEDYFKEQTESVVEKLESELQIEIPELV